MKTISICLFMTLVTALTIYTSYSSRWEGALVFVFGMALAAWMEINLWKQ